MTDWYAPNQQAVREGEAGPAVEGGEREPEVDPLEGMTKDELLAEAEARGVEADPSMTKAQIREALG
jgi:hypothetical protein